jgi:hypothetical protein
MINNIDNITSTICRTGPCVFQKSENEQARVNHNSPSADTVQISKEGHDRLRVSEKQSDLNQVSEELSPEQRQAVEKLKKRDQEVKAHEKAHAAAGAGIVQGGATYQYQRGPDGKMYAVGGEVKIDTTPERDPEDTIRKMQQVRKAALAPTQPSAQDRSVATRASQIEAEARAELTKKDSEDTKDKEEDPSASVSPKLAGIAETPHKISSISHHISITV